MNDRIRKLASLMKEQSIDTLLITDPKHVYYLTGFATEPHERFLGLVVSTEQEPVLIVPSLDEEAASIHSSVKKIATHQDTDNPYLILKQHIPAPTSTLGIEKEQLSVARYEAIHAVIQASHYVDAGSMLRGMRLIKSPDEIVRIRESIRVIEQVLREGLKHVKIGVTEIEIVAELEYQMKKLGAERPCFDSLVLAGEKSAMPHGTPGDRRIQNGELLLFDIGVYVDGYASDITRTFAVGEIDAKLQEIYETVLQANLQAIGVARPGVTYASIDLAARKVIADAGYGPYFMHRVGHGFGIDVHEYPSMHDQNEDIAQEGVVVTIEPGIYVPNLGGVRIEDDIYIAKDGAEVLTSYPKQLTIIEG